MKKPCIILGGLGVLLLFIFTVTAHAGIPMDTVHANVDRVLELLKNKKLNSEVKKERLETIYRDMFDEEELSRLSLGRNWKKLNDAQQQEFIRLFRKILEKAYADKIVSYTNEKIDFNKETAISDNRAEVQTKLITSSKTDRKSTRLNSSHIPLSRMPSSA